MNVPNKLLWPSARQTEKVLVVTLATTSLVLAAKNHQ